MKHTTNTTHTSMWYRDQESVELCTISLYVFMVRCLVDNRYKLPSLNIAAFWNMVPYNLAAGYEQFGGTYPLFLP